MACDSRQDQDVGLANVLDLNGRTSVITEGNNWRHYKVETSLLTLQLIWVLRHA